MRCLYSVDEKASWTRCQYQLLCTCVYHQCYHLWTYILDYSYVMDEVIIIAHGPIEVDSFVFSDQLVQIAETNLYSLCIHVSSRTILWTMHEPVIRWTKTATSNFNSRNREQCRIYIFINNFIAIMPIYVTLPVTIT